MSREENPLFEKNVIQGNINVMINMITYINAIIKSIFNKKDIPCLKIQ